MRRYAFAEQDGPVIEAQQIVIIGLARPAAFLRAV
jgi:hypothetical protein